MAGTLPCPPVEDLQRFLLGQLTEDEAGGLEGHLADCPRCVAGMETLWPRDRLLDVVSVVAHQDRTPAEDEEDEESLRPLYMLRDSAADTPAPRPPDRPEETYDFLAPPQAPDELGRIGSYAILRILGSGGMGVVFAARQDRLRRVVALKMIREGAVSGRERQGRFRSESEIVARLQHPNIVPIHEVGEHDGRPYFTMELVEGGSLAQRLAVAPLPARAAAALTETLARAVQFAHERGVVHRDLKPGNILLQGSGVGGQGSGVRSQESEGNDQSTCLLPPDSWIPKITDFGLAKQVEDQDDTGKSFQTESGAIVGTPAYMAPEQASGRPAEIGPAVDIYALGAILYEALTGRPPFRAATVLETLDQVRNHEPVPPRRFVPGLSRDLETICLKCLEKAPTRRYGSAQDLADDLGRYLRGDPVRARPIGRGRRLLKWAQRKPTAAALVLASVLFSIAFVLIMLVHNVQLREVAAEAQRQQQRAQTQYREARDTLRDMLARANARSSEGIPKLQELRREQQEDALAFYLKIAEQQQDDDPEVRFEVAQARHQAGLLQSTLGRAKEAAQNLRQAEKEYAALSAAFPHRGLFRFHHADTLKVLGGFGGLPMAEAEDCLRRALAVTQDLVRAEPASVPYLTAEADVRITLAAILLNQKKHAEAEDHFRGAAAHYEALLRDQPKSWNFRVVLAKAYVNLSLVMQTTMRPAKEYHDKAEELLEQLHREKRADSDIRETLAALRVNWAYVLRAEGKNEAALADLAKNVTMLTEALRLEPNHAQLRDRLYRTHGVRAETHESMNHFAEAAQDWKRVVELSSAPAQADFQRLFLAMAYARSGQHQLAAKVIEVWHTRSTPKTPADQIYHCGSVYGFALQAALKDKKLSSAERGEAMAGYTKRALDFLRRAKDAYGPARWREKIAEIRLAPEFMTLRSNEAFQRLLPAEKKADTKLPGSVR